MGFFYFVGQSLTVFLRHNLIFVWKLCNNLGMAIFFHFILKKQTSLWRLLKENCPCQNQSKLCARFLAYHVPRAIPLSRYSTWPWFVKILYLSYLCFKYQPSQCIFSLNFDHFPSSPNYVRGVMMIPISVLLVFDLVNIIFAFL